VAAVGEAAQPDDVAVVEVGQQLQLEVEGGRAAPVPAPAVGAPDDGGDEAAGEAGPVRRGRRAVRGPRGLELEHRREAARGGLDLLGTEPPEERQSA